MLRCFFFFQAEDGIRDLVRSRGLGDVYKRQVVSTQSTGVFACTMPTPGSMSSSLQIAEHWDTCIEQSLKNLGYGITAGGAFGMVAFRHPMARVAALAVGAGFGVGYAVADSQHQFDTHKKVVETIPAPPAPAQE
eukprot:TRINITY_DN4077_c0_g1_i2.p2 TRINITY_DN4077_c0_g1~~TRINITY_DN4077_c0_g1_i2.p2  ORF type:complete len:135 (-),score=32.49 TRINITY_DN4077_c0_g1_i2:238-642(-)